jgi:8-oxo-dGTP pyrophosphatase MutT (NUDIX family)
MIKIILNDKTIFLAEDHLEIISQFRLDNAMILFDVHRQKIADLIDTLLISPVESAVVVGNPDENLLFFKQCFRTLRAGGGIVFNNRNELLFIYRRKKWDLPKGKLDRGETIEACAKREVREETGIRKLEIVRHLGYTYHLYLEYEMILKETSWYLMFSEDHWLNPQRNEGIKKAVWVHKNNIRYQLSNTYPSIIDIFQVLLSEN